jgi:hypothetical protein
VTLNANKLAMSFGISTAILWIICSAMVAVMPGPMMSITGHMYHANLEALEWTLTLAGFVIGLVGWVVSAAAAGWLIGWSYNRLEGSSGR